ncbi:serine-threonine protein kinase, plant-type, putative [Ricinus communis]|uniref:non-specific serine/threonine protein kinase n=1 Tax=Ricinus communis TaxID=3988 RepID=B9T577_RICCO|nr:serine-threonine protein kinase, plant-type, putative [Ricinus communis]
MSYYLQLLSILLNNFAGEIPVDIGSLHAVELFRIRGNDFNGTIPKSLFNCTSMRHLSLGGNSLTGPIPTEIGKLSNLVHLLLRYNFLTGSIPSTLLNISAIKTISINVNQLSGHLPSTLGYGLPNLEELYITRNQFIGTLPPSISNASKLTILESSSNSLSGPIPDTLCNLKNLKRLNLADNSFTDELGFLASLARCKELRRLVLIGNPLNSTLPTSIGNLSSIEYFNVQSCNIKGNIPSEIGVLSNLITLHLQNNELVGSIPVTIGGLQKLQRLYLHGNLLYGSIPTDICHLSNLGELFLSNNSLFGPLPACFGDLISLRILHLHSNNFTSGIPFSLWSLKDVLELNLSSNSLSGHIPLSIGNLKVLTQVDFSYNSLSGIIPNAIGSLRNLMSLSLTHNRFEGPIPEPFGELISLESLDLSSNNLSGKIPKSLEQLKYLKYLNVSFNNLDGEVPNKGAFANFSASSFLGNLALCGSRLLPLMPCKNNTHGGSKTSTKLLLIYVLPASILTIAFILVFLRCQKVKLELENVMDIITVGTWRRISFQELEQATDGFCASNLLGAGGYGSVYKGRLEDGTNVAIKVFNLGVEGAFKIFDTECEVMSSIRHRNLVKIISCCSNQDFKAIVLEYMPNGSLEKWLYSHNYCLNIQQRLEVMIDVASALEYLHHGFSAPIVHCDLKPSNVLLDQDMVGHVADFGMAKLLGEGDLITQTKTLATIGYMAPEYGSKGIVSISGDVYSFGILLMETFTRMKPTDDMFGERVLSLKQYIEDALLHNAVSEIADANFLIDEKNLSTKDCVSSILGLALDCSVELPHGRIDMSQVLAALRSIKAQLLASSARTQM